jgi:magnesium chelatase family protein
MGSRHIKTHCGLNTRTSAMLEAAMDKFGLSARAFFRILKLARTIADLDQEQNISEMHLFEAIQYRSLDRDTSGF